MVEEMARDYAQYFRKIDVSKEINPICTSIEDMMARLEEFESLLVTVKIDSNSTIQSNIPEILSHKTEFDLLCKRIDDLEKFIRMVNTNLNTVEQSIEIAEEELGVTDYSFKGLLKPLFGKSKSPNRPTSNLQNGEFQPPEIFKTGDYFVSETVDS